MKLFDKWKCSSRDWKVIICIYILSYTIATTTHLIDLVQGGFFPYFGKPIWANIYWMSLTLLDPLAILLLFISIEFGLVLFGLIILSDVVINTYFTIKIAGFSGILNFYLLCQIGFLVFFILTVGIIRRQIMNNKKDVLLIIDVQKGCFLTPRYNTETLLLNINKLIGFFREAQKPIIFIKHNGEKEKYMLPGSEDFKIHQDIQCTKNDFYVEKKLNNAFYKTSLDNILRSLNAGTLYITGLATDFCINSTIMDAINRDYNVIIVGDAHTTANRPELEAINIINFYNWLWGNLIPSKDYIKVLSTDTIIKEEASNN